MARKAVFDDITVNYRKIYQIVGEVIAKYGTDIVLNQARAIDGFLF